MSKALETVSYTFIFLVFLCLIVDIGNFRISKELVKDALDLSTKAAAQQIDKDSSLIADGIFQIDNDKAKEKFIYYMSKNLNTDEDTIKACMIEYKAINNPGVYLNPADNKNYTINYPTFVAPMRYKFKGLMIDREIILSNNFAASQLRPIFK